MNTKPTNNSGEPRMARVASWSVLAASFGLSASTWVALAVLAGFTGSLTVPVVGVTLRLAWLMPIAVDGYVVVALVLWMSNVPAHVARFAKRNTYGAAGIGIAAQSAYHLLFTASTTDQAWRVVLAAIVGALPPAVAGLAVHMRALLHRETGHQPAPGPQATTTAPAPAAATLPASVPTLPVPSSPQPMTPAATIVTTPEPAIVPAPVAEVLIPTPAELAARITSKPTPAPTRPGPAVPGAAASTSRPRPNVPATKNAPLAPPATDTPVTAPGGSQPMLPLVDPAQLAEAVDVARQYHAEHGVPITVNGLAVRLGVASKAAAPLLAAIETDQPQPPVSARIVNGSRTEAASR